MTANRVRFVELIFIVCLFVVICRLFYWQVMAGKELQAIAQTQHQSVIQIQANRGKILASDGYPIVSNQPAYLTFAYLPDIDSPVRELANTLGPLLAPAPQEIGATPSAEIISQLQNDMVASISAKLSTPSVSWVALSRTTLEPVKNQINALGIKGIGFEASQIRYYPEASMAAQILGFVGSDGSGNPKGYFGLEGHYNYELTGRPGIVRQEKDALGKPIVTGEYADIAGRDGRDLKTYMDRGLQFLVEAELKKGIEKYQAKAGEVVIVDPKTGGILAMAAFPNFDPSYHRLYDQQSYKNPSIADTYEPGSTFKTVIMAAALNEKVIAPDTVCDDFCSGPVSIGQYSIRTWNNEYHPGQTVTDILRQSDNVGMVFIGQKLGKNKLVDYISRFGFGKSTNVDLEGEETTKLRTKWGDIDAATASFGQGIAVNTLQMLMAVAAIANDGKLMEPHMVQAVVDGTKTAPIPPKVVRQVVSKEAARTVTEMMVKTAEAGEAKWAIPPEYQIAGKTGTAQIPIAGHYDAEKTMASFVGFAPASDPRFVMIVKLKEPQTSPWASETAAPLWASITKHIFRYYNLPTLPAGQ